MLVLGTVEAPSMTSGLSVPCIFEGLGQIAVDPFGENFPLPGGEWLLLLRWHLRLT